MTPGGPADPARRVRADALARRCRALADRFGGALVAANALVLMMASWTPRTYMVRSGILSGHVERTIAYALSGAFMCSVLAGKRATWQVAAALVAYASILEVGQIWVPGRHSGIDDFLFSSAGVIVGALASAALQRRANRHIA